MAWGHREEHPHRRGGASLNCGCPSSLKTSSAISTRPTCTKRIAAGPPNVCINAGRKSLHVPTPASAARIVVEVEFDIARTSGAASRGDAASIDRRVGGGVTSAGTRRRRRVGRRGHALGFAPGEQDEPKGERLQMTQSSPLYQQLD